VQLEVERNEPYSWFDIIQVLSGNGDVSLVLHVLLVDLKVSIDFGEICALLGRFMAAHFSYFFSSSRVNRDQNKVSAIIVKYQLLFVDYG
jgi:hypothetical protein